MRTVLRVVWPALTVTMLMVIPAAILAQADVSDTADAPFTGTTPCPRSDELFANPPVLDRPFSAEATTVWHPPAGSGRPEMRATTFYYRDGAGRVRVEQTFAGYGHGPQRVIVWPDPSSVWAYALDPITHTSKPVGNGIAEMMVGTGSACQSFVLPIPANRFISFYIYGQPTGAPPDLTSNDGPTQRVIEGVQATGTRFPLGLRIDESGNAFGERWVSPALKLVVYSRSEGAPGGDVEYQLKNINRAEPAADLFEVPADYLEIARTPMCWGGFDSQWQLRGCMSEPGTH